MRIPRIYQPGTLKPGTETELAEDAANHVGRVLRMQAGAELQLFNGDGLNYQAQIIESGKKQVRVKVISSQSNPVESPLRIHLGQGISRGDRMDFAIQKAVELGVTEITPLLPNDVALNWMPSGCKNVLTSGKKLRSAPVNKVAAV